MVLFTLIFSLFGVLMWVAAGVLIYFRRRQLRKTELMRQVETLSAAGVTGVAPGTLVEVKGTLRCESPLKSEMAGRECAYYLSRVIREYYEEDHGDNDVGSNRRSETIASYQTLSLYTVRSN